MLLPCKIQPNDISKPTKTASKTKFDNNSHRGTDLKRPQMTSNDINKPKTNTKSKKKYKTFPKSGSVHENIEINDHYLDEILDNNNIGMQLAMQIICNDKTVRTGTIQDLKEI